MKIWFWPSQRTRRSFLWTKSSEVLTEVAICSPGSSQLPSLNAFFLNIRKPPITMYLSPHSVPLSELVCLQSARILNNSPLWTKTPRQCTFFLTLQNILSPGLWPQIERMLLYRYLWWRDWGRTLNTIDKVWRRAALKFEKTNAFRWSIKKLGKLTFSERY